VTFFGLLRSSLITDIIFLWGLFTRTSEKYHEFKNFFSLQAPKTHHAIEAAEGLLPDMVGVQTLCLFPTFQMHKTL
jgi:hypothetical protein